MRSNIASAKSLLIRRVVSSGAVTSATTLRSSGRGADGVDELLVDRSVATGQTAGLGGDVLLVDRSVAMGQTAGLGGDVLHAPTEAMAMSGSENKSEFEILRANSFASVGLDAGSEDEARSIGFVGMGGLSGVFRFGVEGLDLGEYAGLGAGIGLVGVRSRFSVGIEIGAFVSTVGVELDLVICVSEVGLSLVGSVGRAEVDFATVLTELEHFIGVS